MSSPRDIINRIRKEKFGIDLDTDQDAKRVIDSLNKSLHNALERLSHDLYSEDIHFILELIQNADDNDYAESVNPTLKFILDDEKIITQNNEKGFEDENVKALCDVGESTKSKAKGYIGEKGIGFKSVFKVSDEPHIFSRGYNFKFRSKDEDDKLGFVVPYWIDEIPNYVDLSQTNIVLPFRPGTSLAGLNIGVINPTLLLFLNKLKILEINNTVQDENIEIIKDR